MTATVWDAVLDAARADLSLPTDPRQLAAVVATLVEQVGWDAVRPHLTGKPPIRAPRPGTAVLGCRCGKAMGLDEMVSLRLREYQPGDRGGVDRIVCRSCTRAELAAMRDDHTDQHLTRWRNQRDLVVLTAAEIADARDRILDDWARDNPALHRLWLQVTR